jgi:hypothetical protein
MKSYCVKCKRTTGYAVTPKVIVTKNNKYRVVGKCSECGITKSTFTSKRTGDGILGKLLGLPNGKVPILSDIPLIGSLI